MSEDKSPADLFRQWTVVDLTLLIAEELPSAWAKHMPYQQKTFNYFDDVNRQVAPLHSTTGPYQTRWLLIDEHTGTHVDAPAHFIPETSTGLPHAADVGSVTVEQIPLTQLIGPAVVVDIPADLPGGAPGVSPIITRQFLRDWEEEHGEFVAGDIVLFHTGWDSHYVAGEKGREYTHAPLVTRDAPGWPAPDADAMRHLIERGVTCVGTDGASMGSAHDGAGVHYEGLAERVAYVEALGHLDSLPVRGAVFCCAPIKVARGTGAPARAFAWVPGE